MAGEVALGGSGPVPLEWFNGFLPSGRGVPSLLGGAGKGMGMIGIENEEFDISFLFGLGYLRCSVVNDRVPEGGRCQ